MIYEITQETGRQPEELMWLKTTSFEHTSTNTCLAYFRKCRL